MGANRQLVIISLAFLGSIFVGLVVYLMLSKLQSGSRETQITQPVKTP